MAASTYSDYMKQFYTDGISNTSSKANDLWEQMKSSASQNSQLTQDYSKTVNNYLNSIQADKAAVTGRVDDLTNTIKSDKAMLTGKYDKLENYQYNYNPYTSDIGQSILSNFKWQGKNASDNVVADNSANNSGNIDSFAAANSARQQLVFDVAGHNAALNDFNTRATGIQQTLRDLGNYNLGTYDATNRGIESIVSQNNAGYNASGKALDNLLNSNLAGQAQSSDDFNKYMSLLGFMGDQNQQVFSNDMNYNQQLFDNDQTAQNNNMLRLAQESAITGYVPDELLLKNNKYMSLVNNPSVDFAQMIYDKQAELGKTTDPTQKQAIQNEIRLLNAARDYKIANVEGYDKYASTMGLVTVPGQLNAESQLSKDGFDAQKYLASLGYDFNLAYQGNQIASDEKMQGNQIMSTEKMQAIQNAATWDQLTAQLNSTEKMHAAELSNEYNKLMKQIGANSAINNDSLKLEYYKTNLNYDIALKEIEAAAKSTASAKPNLTAAQAKEAYDSGIRTPEVISAMNSYYGSSYENEVQSKTAADNLYYNVSDSAKKYLDTISGTPMNESTLINDVLSKSKEYDLNIDDVKKVFDAYGYDTSWLNGYRNAYLWSKGIVKN